MNFCRNFRLIGCLMLGCLTSLAVAQETPAPNAAAANEQAANQATPTAAEIKAWIEQLDSDKFLVRESATQKLTQASRDAIPVLTESVQSGSLEKAFRCIHVLRNFAVGEDVATEKEATAALTSIAAANTDRVSAYAEETLKRIAPLKEERAIRILSRLGMKFTSYNAQPLGFAAGLMGPGVIIDSNYEGTVEDLYYLQHLAFVEDVQISRTDVTAEWFAQIAKMPNVRLMTIKDGPVDTAMLHELEPIFPNLNGIRLYYINVDGSVAPLLSKLTSASVVEFFGLPITDADKQRMLQSLPLGAQATAKFRSGGFLGVRGIGNNGVCQIESVNQDSGAHAAGLKGGDIVTKADGTQVQDFQHLIELLRDKEVGETIDVTVMRRGKTVNLSITLGKWPLRQQYEP